MALTQEQIDALIYGGLQNTGQESYVPEGAAVTDPTQSGLATQAQNDANIYAGLINANKLPTGDYTDKTAENEAAILAGIERTMGAGMSDEDRAALMAQIQGGDATAAADTLMQGPNVFDRDYADERAQLAAVSRLWGVDDATNQQRFDAMAQQAAARQAQAIDPNTGIRRDQNANLRALQMAALGKGPSAAQAQLQAGVDANIGALMAAAASQRGGMAAGRRDLNRNVSQANQMGANAAAQLRAQEMNAARGMYTDALSGVRGQDTDIARANQLAQLQMTGLNDAQQRALMGLGMDQDARKFQQQIAAFQLQQGNDDTAGQVLAAIPMIGQAAGAAGGAVQGAATALQGLAALSDKRTKTKIARDEKGARALLDHLSPQSWEYKDPKHGKGRYLGFMAQDLEKSKAGKEMIVDIDGKKGVDVSRVSMAALASAADLHKRLKRLEKGA